MGRLWRVGSASPSLLVRLCLEVRPWLLPPLLPPLLLLLLQAENRGARAGCWSSGPTLLPTMLPTLFRCSPAARGRWTRSTQ